MQRFDQSIDSAPLRRAALIGGLSLLAMTVAAPFAELLVYSKLVVERNPAQTIANILAHHTLFIFGIFGYVITFAFDVVAAWAFYVLLKPVNSNYSLLTAWFRLVYTVIALAAVANLFVVLRLVSGDYSTIFSPGQLDAQVKLAFTAFRSDWSFGFLFFGIHLVMLGALVIRSRYIPTLLGVLLVIAGLGWAVTTLGPLFFPDIRLQLVKLTFFGEMIFMVWLLLGGPRIKEPNQVVSDV